MLGTGRFELAVAVHRDDIYRVSGHEESMLASATVSECLHEVPPISYDDAVAQGLKIARYGCRLVAHGELPALTVRTSRKPEAPRFSVFPDTPELLDPVMSTRLGWNLDVTIDSRLQKVVGAGDREREVTNTVQAEELCRFVWREADE